MSRDIALLTFVLLAACWPGGIARSANQLAEPEPPVPASFSGAVLLARGDTILIQRAYGLADAGQAEPNTPHTVFRIGSLTKVFTAASVLILADEHRLALSDPIGDRWPGWPAAWSAITAHHLLVHTAGIGDFATRPDFPAAWLPAVTAAMLIERFGQRPAGGLLAGVPQYSNSHYVLLGELVARAAGQTFDEVLRSRILAPAALAHTRLLHAGDDGKSRARGYTDDTTRWQPAEELPPDLLNAAGGAASTVEDLFRLVRALESDAGLLSERGRRRMWSQHHGNHGYGWTAARHAGETVWICMGRVRGFSAAMLRAPAANLVAVVLANRDDAPVLPIGMELLAQGRRQGP